MKLPLVLVVYKINLPSISSGDSRKIRPLESPRKISNGSGCYIHYIAKVVVVSSTGEHTHPMQEGWTRSRKMDVRQKKARNPASESFLSFVCNLLLRLWQRHARLYRSACPPKLAAL